MVDVYAIPVDVDGPPEARGYVVECSVCGLIEYVVGDLVHLVARAHLVAHSTGLLTSTRPYSG